MNITFESACRIVKSEYPEIGKELDALSSLLLASGVAILAVPIAAAPGVTALTPAVIVLSAIGALSNIFGVKNEIPKIIESIISKITSKRDQDPHEQFVRMQRAYILICYTAFFEALRRDKQLAPLLRKIRLSEEEKREMLIYAVRDLLSKAGAATGDVETNLLSFEIDLPHPGDTFETQRKYLLPLYQKLTESIAKFFEMDVVKKQVQAKGGQEKIQEVLAKLPEKGLESFRDQYNALAMKFPEFAIWLNLQKDDKIVHLTEQSLRLLKESSLAEQRQTDIVLHALANHYTSIIDAPIIDDPGSQLRYPKKRDIFILQSFKVIHYKNAEQLKDSFWTNVPERHDLESFLQAYFNHEESCTKTPLIILGQPGSGKSLLTTMIAARRIPLPFTPIRVELRHTNAEDPINTQIEEQIRRDTYQSIDWTAVRDYTVNDPVLVLFDGYDELLQATGKAFSGYLNKVKDFQTRQPVPHGGQVSVRAVVTSRFTLIDKAVIPPGSTIIRLLEFDETRQELWIDKWNAANASYFQQSHTEPFQLSQDHKDIKKLAEQPLLLMMLAIYDSEKNPLRNAGAFDQSLLYNRLLRRFVERELKKEEADAYSWQPTELDDAVDYEIERLGVAAIGMFNRRKIYIQAEELNADLKSFNLEQSSLEKLGHGHFAAMGHELLPSEKVFGGFFFQKLESVRKTTQAVMGRKVSTRADDTAYEFLHNTFGEFLTADFMLRKILEETQNIRDQITKRSARSKRFSSSMPLEIDLAAFNNKKWYELFIYAPLFSRPVVVSLLREWSHHCVQNAKRDFDEFLVDLDSIVVNHINLLLTGNVLPSLMLNDQQSFTSLPVIGYVAIYTLNLILLRTLLDPDTYIFDEEKSFKSQDNTRAWDHLTYLWRSWFSLETLNELAAIFEAQRDDSRVQIQVKKVFESSSGIRRFMQVLNVSQALGDNITGGLVGLLVHDPYNNRIDELNAISKKLESEQIENLLHGDLFIKKLRHLRVAEYIHVQDAMNLINNESLSRLSYPYYKAVDILIEISSLFKDIYNDQGIELEFNPNFINMYFNEDMFMSEVMKAALLLGNQIIIDRIVSRPEKILDHANEDPDVGTRTLVEIVQFARQRGKSVFSYVNLERLQEIIHKQHHLPMALAAAMIGLAREEGNQEIIDFLYNYYSPYMSDLDAPMFDNLATELVKLARERGDGSVLDYFVSYLSKRFRKRNDVPIELVLEVLRLGRDTKEGEALAQIMKYISEIMRTKRRLPLVLMNELLHTLQEIDDEHTTQKLTHEYFIPYIKEMIIPNIPQELVVSIIKFARKIHDQELLQFFSHYLRNILDIQMLVPVDLAVEVLKMVQETDIDDQISTESFYHKSITPGRCYLGLLPIDTVVDLRRLAQKFSDEELMKKINERLKV